MRASIDIGSNSVLLLAGEILEGQFIEHLSEANITGLGKPGWRESLPDVDVSSTASRIDIHTTNQISSLLSFQSSPRMKIVNRQ